MDWGGGIMTEYWAAYDPTEQQMKQKTEVHHVADPSSNDRTFSSE